MKYIKVVTNLDVHYMEKWPDQLPEIPRVGDYIQSKRKMSSGNRLELKVRSITWKYDDHFDEYYVEVYLCIPDAFRTVSDFHIWYDKVK